MCCVYDLWSFDLRHMFAVKVFCPRETRSIPSVADLWPAADWQEREAYDMFGIDLRRASGPSADPVRRRLGGVSAAEGLRLPARVPRHPGSVELDWQQQPDYPK